MSKSICLWWWVFVGARNFVIVVRFRSVGGFDWFRISLCTHAGMDIDISGISLVVYSNFQVKSRWICFAFLFVSTQAIYIYDFNELAQWIDCKIEHCVASIRVCFVRILIYHTYIRSNDDFIAFNDFRIYLFDFNSSGGIRPTHTRIPDRFPRKNFPSRFAWTTILRKLMNSFAPNAIFTGLTLPSEF